MAVRLVSGWGDPSEYTYISDVETIQRVGEISRGSGGEIARKVLTAGGNCRTEGEVLSEGPDLTLIWEFTYSDGRAPGQSGG